MKKALEEQVIAEMKIGRKDFEVIESGGETLLATYRSNHSLHGYTFDENGTQSELKILKVQTAKDGKQYVMANRKRYNIEDATIPVISEEVIRKELESAESMKRLFESLVEDEGGEMSRNCRIAIENQNYIIEKLNGWLK